MAQKIEEVLMMILQAAIVERRRQLLEIKFDEKLFPKRQQHAHNGVRVAVAYPGQGPARLRHALAGIVAQPQVGGPNQAQPGVPG